MWSLSAAAQRFRQTMQQRGARVVAMAAAAQPPLLQTRNRAQKTTPLRRPIAWGVRFDELAGAAADAIARFSGRTVDRDAQDVLQPFEQGGLVGCVNLARRISSRAARRAYKG
jgi:hypothetical protein